MRFYPLLKKPLISKKKCLSLFFFISIFLFCVFYLYFFRNITDDELYNYGYAHNILNHLVPYRDFNMIVPPLFAYLCALFQFVLGDKLIVYDSLVCGYEVDILSVFVNIAVLGVIAVIMDYRKKHYKQRREERIQNYYSTKSCSDEEIKENNEENK